jgi:hypothetical protein
MATTMANFDDGMREQLNERIKPKLARLNRLAQEDRLLMIDKPWTWRALLQIVDSVLGQIKKQTTQTDVPGFKERTTTG